MVKMTPKQKALLEKLILERKVDKEAVDFALSKIGVSDTIQVLIEMREAVREYEKAEKLYGLDLREFYNAKFNAYVFRKIFPRITSDRKLGYDTASLLSLEMLKALLEMLENPEAPRISRKEVAQHGEQLEQKFYDLVVAAAEQNPGPGLA